MFFFPRTDRTTKMAGGARRRGPEASAKNGDAAEDLPELEEGQWDKVSATPTSPILHPFPVRMARETQRQALFFGLGKLTEPLPVVVVFVFVFTG